MVFPIYAVEGERLDCANVGLEFTGLHSVDYTGLHPRTVADGLRYIDTALKQDGPVFVHCTAGVGRTGVISAAWAMTRGWPSTDAAEMFFRFCDAIYSATELPSGGEEAYFERIGVHEHWWSIVHIAEALDLPTPAAHRQYAHPLAPEGARANGWSKLYRDFLTPWRRSA